MKSREFVYRKVGFELMIPILECGETPSREFMWHYWRDWPTCLSIVVVVIRTRIHAAREWISSRWRISWQNFWYIFFLSNFHSKYRLYRKVLRFLRLLRCDKVVSYSGWLLYLQRYVAVHMYNMYVYMYVYYCTFLCSYEETKLSHQSNWKIKNKN